MKTYLHPGVVLASLLLVLCFPVKAQNNASSNHNNISIMVSNKADLDCMETELLPSMKDVSLVYANPHSGLMILKSETMNEKSLLKTINECVSTRNENIEMTVIESAGTYYLSSK